MAMTFQRVKDGIRYGSNSHLQSGPVFHQARHVIANLHKLIRQSLRLGYDLRQRRIHFETC